MSSWGERVIGAARLDIDTYEEVEADESATWQAGSVVVLAAIAQAVGASALGVNPLAAALSALVGWALWSGVTYLIGARILKGTATWGELLRTIGFAQAPGFLYVLGFIPGVGGVLRWVVAVWILIAGIIAIRQALDVSTGRAILVAFIGWLLLFIPMLMLGLEARPAA
jgi:hypothetical protein